jgi:hypothetical protein
VLAMQVNFELQHSTAALAFNSEISIHSKNSDFLVLKLLQTRESFQQVCARRIDNENANQKAF